MQKSNKGALKRFKITAKGKVKFKHAYLRHIMTSKTEKQKRNLKKHAILTKSEEGRVKRLLPFSF